MNKIFYILAFIVLAVVIWIIVLPKNEHFIGRGPFLGGRGYGRRFYNRNPYRHYYCPYWNSYTDNIKDCIINNVNKCGETKECYDMAINKCT